MKYQKKPKIIEAVQWTGENFQELVDFAGHGNVMAIRDKHGTQQVEVNTREGSLRASINDYIIKGIQEEFYPCKPDIFAETYEPYVQDPMIIEGKAQSDIEKGK